MSKNIIEVKYIVIHHSGINLDKNDITGEKQWQSICKNHQKEWRQKFPWTIAPYHYGIGPKGDIFKGQDENFFCIHAGDDFYNFRSLAICFIGNFEESKLTMEALKVGANLVRDLMVKYGVKKENVLRHKDIIETQCPGKFFPWDSFKKLIEIEQWKFDALEFGKKIGLIKSEHNPYELVDIGTLLAVLKNFYEIIKRSE